MKNIRRNWKHFQDIKEVFETKETKKIKKEKKPDDHWIKKLNNKSEYENEEISKERGTEPKQEVRGKRRGEPQLDQTQKKQFGRESHSGKGEFKTGNMVRKKGMGCSFSMAHESQPKPTGEIERDEIEIDPRKKRNPLGHIKQHFEGKDKDQITGLKLKFLDKNLTAVANHTLRKKDWNQKVS